MITTWLGEAVHVLDGRIHVNETNCEGAWISE